MVPLGKYVAATLVLGAVASDSFNVLQHLGGNGQWFPGPDITGISSDVPAGCKVDLFASFSRHGSRYPDTGAYKEWTDLYYRIQAAGNLTITDSKLAFLSSWKPVLTDPDQQIAQLSTTGYKELYDMGATFRLRYSHLYDYNTNLTLWANYYKSSPRVRDSARLFARGFLGPNATDLGTIYALNSSDSRSFMNSLATSDLCPTYSDSGGSPYKDTWDSHYLPPIQNRLNGHIHGSFNLTQTDVSIIPYLCGFETQITGGTSPFCSVFTEAEILQYEYAQDLRYWYGNGLGTDVEKYMMLPVLDGLVQRFVDGPNKTYVDEEGEVFKPPRVMVSFTNDGQVNQLIAALGVFDGEEQLPAAMIPENRLFRASNLVRMRGTVGFERLSCSSSSSGSAGYGNGSRDGVYIRIVLNDVVYPVAGCKSGPGSSCPLAEYRKIVKGKLAEAGNFGKLCNVTDSSIPSNRSNVTFFTNPDLPFAIIVKP
ncbi:phosphoglycerate mutase-like protein [Lentithecium fluviatile CBS 122367]|uniref:Phosphoglycerate mutase-like protein n=1 Tax=Lentithecium fluviatile CBS 122367 TaxID=1168545 RepID=A0A6G1IH21_9PLEO|nr:phosphoglycerate mutase-like protein [Lentithecium fluviatile CBS 122367]